MPTALASRTAPGPSARYPGELMLKLSRERMTFFRELAAQYGDVVRLRIGGQVLVQLLHPDDIRDVLVTHQKRFHKGRALERARVVIGNGLLTSEGEQHLRQRRLVQPAFHRARIAAYGEAMTAAAMVTHGHWRDGMTLDMHEAMMSLTLTIVAATLFGADVQAESTEIGEALDAVFAGFSFGFGPLASLFDALPTARRRRFTAAKRRLDETITRLIEERRQSGAESGDLLSMLLHATDTEGDGGGMSDQLLRDEALTLFLAGHETTANALTWTWLLLARHPEAERALHAEIDAVLGDRLPTMDDMARLPMTRAIVAESMRLHPPAYVIGRRAVEPHMVGEYTFAKRTVFLLPTFLVHRDPRWWPEPDAFRPERWLDAEAAAARPKLAYVPFGAGTRICVGEQFAWMEAILVLATLARRWRVRIDGPDPEPDPIITLRPKGGMPARLERR